MPFGDPQTRIYVTIVGDMLAVRSSESDPKAVKRETKTGKTIFERRYKNLTGRIREVGFKNNDFDGKKWEDLVVVIDDGADIYQLSMPFPSKYSLSFLRAVKNVDLASDITFNPWTKTVNGKVKAALYMNHAGSKESVPWYYGVGDQSNGLPELVPYTVPGSEETKYSDVNRNKFLKNMLEQDIMPKLSALWQTTSQRAAAPPPEVGHPDLAEADDDLPF